jgi:Tat protein secretion system quality control protein TatD with DNase activity
VPRTAGRAARESRRKRWIPLAAFVTFVGEAVAEVLGTEPAAVAEATWANAARVYRLPA